MSNHDHDNDVNEPVVQEEYDCTEAELRRAGGFTIASLDEMAETQFEFITDPRERLEYLERRHGSTDPDDTGAMLELVEMYDLDPRDTGAWHTCRAL